MTDETIITLSWRRDDSRRRDDGLGVQPLLATDAGSATILHLPAGGATEKASHGAGQLVVVVRGSGRVEIDRRSAAVAEGEAVRLPAGTPHRLASEEGMSVLVLTYPESDESWRVSRVGPQGQRWVAGVFEQTDRARTFRDRLRGELDGETIRMD